MIWKSFCLLNFSSISDRLKCVRKLQNMQCIKLIKKFHYQFASYKMSTSRMHRVDFFFKNKPLDCCMKMIAKKNIFFEITYKFFHYGDINL